jgi:hypothetical protein
VRVWFDRLTMIGEKTVRPEHFDSPFALSLSKGERFAQHRLVEGRPFRPSATVMVLRTSRLRAETPACRRQALRRAGT